VDENWILTVLYVPELQLGLAIAKTKNVLRLLEGIELPPPPEEFEESSETNLQVLESIAIQAASVEETPVAKPASDAVTSDTPPVATEAPSAPAEDLSPDDFNVSTTTIPERGPQYSTSLTLDSELNSEMKTLYRNFGFDVLMLVNGTNSVENIADSMFQPTDRVIDLLKWSATRGIIEVPRIVEGSEEAAATTAGGSMGKYVKCPKFEGDLSKVSGDDMAIIRLCDGKQTQEQIAEATSLPVSKVIQTLAKYRKSGLKMIGRTIK
ncbi:MAG: hypothetical protein ACTSPB_22500, partial [Candidatus Thorarchaeota archaeon]